MDNAIKILLDSGYKPAGETPREVVKIITAKSYPIPGAEVRIGGRLRFEKVPYRATVGKRTVCLYEIVDGKPTNFQNIKTKKFNACHITVYNKSFNNRQAQRAAPAS